MTTFAEDKVICGLLFRWAAASRKPAAAGYGHLEPDRYEPRIRRGLLRPWLYVCSQIGLENGAPSEVVCAMHTRRRAACSSPRTKRGLYRAVKRHWTCGDFSPPRGGAETAHHGVVCNETEA